MKFKRGDMVRVIKDYDYSNASLHRNWFKCLYKKGIVGTVFSNKVEVTINGNLFSQPFMNEQIELLPISRTEIYKALTQGE